MAVDDDQVEHLSPGEHLDATLVDLPIERAVRAEQQLLAGLAASVERAGDLRAAKGTVVELAAVLTGEGDALRHAVVDDEIAHRRQPVDVCLASAVVAALHRVVEETVDAVAVVLIVLGGVDAALGCDGVGATRAVVHAEALHDISELREGGGGGGASEPGTHHDDFELPLVGGVDELELELVPLPLLLERPTGNLGIELRHVESLLQGYVSKSRM